MVVFPSGGEACEVEVVEVDPPGLATVDVVVELDEPLMVVVEPVLPGTTVVVDEVVELGLDGLDGLEVEVVEVVAEGTGGATGVINGMSGTGVTTGAYP